MLTLLIGCCLLLLVFYHTFLDLYEIYLGRLPPGPLTMPLVGGMYRLQLKCPHLSLVKLGKQYGKIFSLRLGPAGRTVFLQDLKYINQVFEDPDCNDRPSMPLFDILNNGADSIGSCPYGKAWKDLTHIYHRGIAKLSHGNLEDRVNHSFQQFFERMETSNGYECIPNEDMFNTCSAIFGSLVYGIKPEMLESKELKTRIDDFRLIMGHLSPMHPVNVFPSLSKLPLTGLKKIMAIVNKRDKDMQNSFFQHQSVFNGEINDFIDIIVSHQMNGETGSDADETSQGKPKLQDIMLCPWVLYLAGCQTLTDMFVWSILYLSVNPHVQEKIQKEIEMVFPEQQCITGIIKKKASLHYTRATMFELMRRSSPVAMGLPKVNTKDIQLGEFIIPKGTQIMANQWTIHHSEEHWPDPFTVKPERFLDDEGRLFSLYHIFHKMPFLTFSYGKRPCLGKNLALDLFLVFLVGIMKNFNLSQPEGHVPDLDGQFHFNLEPGKNPIVFTKR